MTNVENMDEVTFDSKFDKTGKVRVFLDDIMMDPP